MAMASKIFVNYRRDDTRADARSIRDRLAAMFGKTNVFMDVDDLAPGERFDRRLDQALSQCGIFLAVIGPRWVDILNDRAQNGDHDYVRQEIATALMRGILVIPVLVGGARLPRSDALPSDLQALVLHQKQDITHERFGRDMTDLIDVIKSNAPRRSAARWVLPASLTIAVISLGALGVLLPGRYSGVQRPLQDSGLRTGDVFRDCSQCPEMVVVPVGEFIMGSPDTEPGRSSAESPRHSVRIGRRLAIGKVSVTVKEYEAFIASTGGVSDGGGCSVWTAYGHRFEKDRSFKSPSFAQGPNHPAVCVSWQAATTYTNWLTTQSRKTYRLLSEAEWEYAARAGSTTRYYFGDDEAQLCKYGNGADRTSAFLWGNHLCSDGVGVQTAEVGRYSPNTFGLYDMIGNAWSWAQDCWNNSYVGAPADGSPWISGDCNRRVIRGGSWDNGPKDMRSTTRGAHSLQAKDNIGFRVARELDQ